VRNPSFYVHPLHLLALANFSTALPSQKKAVFWSNGFAYFAGHPSWYYPWKYFSFELCNGVGRTKRMFGLEYTNRDEPFLCFFVVGAQKDWLATGESAFLLINTLHFYSALGEHIMLCI
jgi:hypothetical protein